MKPIKFNLVMDGKIIRSLDDLEENFNIDDVYDLFKKRILQKWLRLQNENSIVEKLDNINDDNTKVTLEKILHAFGYETTGIDSGIFSHIYGQAYREEVAAAIAEKKSYSEIVDRHYVNYINLKRTLKNTKFVQTQEQDSEISSFLEIPDSESELLGEPGSLFYRIAQQLLKKESQKSSDASRKDENIIGILAVTRAFTRNGMKSVENLSYEMFISQLQELKNYNQAFGDRSSLYKSQRKAIEEQYMSILDDEKGTKIVTNKVSKPDYDGSTIEEIKAIIDEISNNYIDLFHLDFYRFFVDFVKDNPIIIMTCLMNERIRKILLDDQNIQSHLENYHNDKATINLLKPYMKSYAGDTDGMWKYLGDKEKKYLVLSISAGAARVGEQKDLKNDFDYRAINGKYLILEGLMFKSSSSNQTILYLEV